MASFVHVCNQRDDMRVERQGCIISLMASVVQAEEFFMLQVRLLPGRHCQWQPAEPRCPLAFARGAPLSPPFLDYPPPFVTAFP